MWKLWLTVTLLTTVIGQDATPAHGTSTEPQETYKYIWGGCPNTQDCFCIYKPPGVQLACKLFAPSYGRSVCKISLDDPVDYPAICH